MRVSVKVVRGWGVRYACFRYIMYDKDPNTGLIAIWNFHTTDGFVTTKAKYLPSFGIVKYVMKTRKFTQVKL